MPRGSRSSGSRMGSGNRSAPVPQRHAPPTQVARAPTATPAHPPVAPVSQGPGLMGQMAATAGGVAIGSAVGHVIGSALTGGSGRGEAQPVVQQQAAPEQHSQQYAKACEFELQQFLDCAKSNDLSACQGFNDILKECRVRYGI